jgi:hypothetical protein
MSESTGAGDGVPPDWEAQYAQQALSTLIIELLRALARGDDDTRRVTGALIDFTQRASKAGTPLGEMVHATIARLHSVALANERDRDDFEAATRDILVHALRVAAESMADDNAARGRRSKRFYALNSAIEHEVRQREERSRKHGWSYVENLTKHLDKGPPSARTRNR